jgi:hypothetical protein
MSLDNKIPLSHVIKELHEKLQTELKMYKYQGKANSIVHQVAENEEAVEKVLSKPKRKKKSLEERLTKDRSTNPNSFNVKDDGTSKTGDAMDTTQFVNEIVDLVKTGVISFPGIKKPNLVQSDLMDQIGSLESKSEHQPFRISRAKVTQKTDEILIVADGSLKFNPTIFTTDGVLADEAPAPKQKTPSSAPSLFDVRHKQATATAPVQTTLTKK